MHLLGREMKVWATLPDGSEKPLVWIKDWDFNWQATYYLKEPMALPKGTKVHMTAYYDNSSQNPRNPLKDQSARGDLGRADDGRDVHRLLLDHQRRGAVERPVGRSAQTDRQPALIRLVTRGEKSVPADRLLVKRLSAGTLSCRILVAVSGEVAGEGKFDPEAGAAAGFAEDADRAVVGVGDALDEAGSDAGAAGRGADGLRREERLFDLGRDAGAVVLDGDATVVSVRERRPRSRPSRRSEC